MQWAGSLKKLAAYGVDDFGGTELGLPLFFVEIFLSDSIWLAVAVDVYLTMFFYEN